MNDQEKRHPDLVNFYFYQQGYKEGEAAGRKAERELMMEFAEWWASECDVFNGTVEEAFEYWQKNVEPQKL